MEISRPETVVAATVPPAGCCPWLVYQSKDYKQQTFCCNITGPSPVTTHHKRIPVLHDKEILTCSYGWLVLYDVNTKLLSLCNSTTFDTTIPLPTLDQILSPKNCQIDCCVLLSSSPASNNSAAAAPQDFKVLVFLEKVSAIMCCRVVQDDDDDQKWTKLRYWNQLKTILGKEEYKILTDDGHLFFTQAVSCAGKIYAKLGVAGFPFPEGIWSIEFVEEEEEDEKSISVVLSMLDNEPDLNHPPLRCRNDYLLESCGELFLLCFSESQVVEVRKLNLDCLQWERVESLKDRVFFVGQRFCLSCRESGPGRIYFTKNTDQSFFFLKERDYQSLYCYYIEESILVSMPHPNLPTSWISSPIWIMPQILISEVDCWEDENHKGSNSRGITSLELAENHKSNDDFLHLSNLPLMDTLQEKTFFTTVIKNLYIFFQVTDLGPLDYMNFRAASRICRSSIPHVKWRKALSGTQTNLDFPLLMFAHQDESLHKFVDPRLNSCDNDHNYLMRIPNPLEDGVIHYSHRGLVLTSRKDAIHIYNPFTGDIISFTGPGGSRKLSLFFAPDPAGSGYVVISICFLFIGAVFVSTIRPGEEEWTFDGLDNSSSNDDFNLYKKSPVLFEDAFYYINKYGNLRRFKMEKDNEMIWEVLDEPETPCSCSHENYLLECGGEMLAVFIGDGGNWVSVYKLNQSRRVWETVANLGNYVLYLSQTSSFSVETSSGLRNRIYFPWFRGSGLVFFSLDTGKWHFTGSEDESSHFYDTKLHLNSCWIQPTWC